MQILLGIFVSNKKLHFFIVGGRIPPDQPEQAFYRTVLKPSKGQILRYLVESLLLRYPINLIYMRISGPDFQDAR